MGKQERLVEYLCHESRRNYLVGGKEPAREKEIGTVPSEATVAAVASAEKKKKKKEEAKEGGEGKDP